MKRLEGLQHPLVKRLTSLRKARKERQQSGCAVIEGKKIVRENFSLVRTLLTITSDLPFSLPEGVQMYQVTPEIIRKISGVKSPEGILAEVELPALELPRSLRRVLVLENLNDPGNLGTLIRTALAFGWDGVYLLGHCCDPFNDKVIRASKGAVFRMPIQSGDIEAFKGLVDAYRLTVWVADLGGRDFKEVSVAEKMALVLGSEAHGPSDQVLAMGEVVTIPIGEKMESLNVAVAGGIFVYTTC